MQKRVVWILQSNQVTPMIIKLLDIVKQRLKHMVTLEFMIPSTSTDIVEKTEALNPTVFDVKSRWSDRSYKAFLRKKHLIGDGTFAEGLPIAEPLLIDDLAGGVLHQTLIKIPDLAQVASIILQIPTPLGSYDSEERVFHAALLSARHHGVPTTGYELLPLDTRWTLAPSLVDGVITTRDTSHTHLKACLPETTRNWLLPRFEASLFSPHASQYDLNGLKAAYHFLQTLGIPENRSIIYLPHNVAMHHEYRTLMAVLGTIGTSIHLMIGVGKDQVRGFYTQQETIEKVCAGELSKFASHSFHDINKVWEMAMADGVIACSSCFSTMIAETHHIPTLILDTALPGHRAGYLQRVPDQASLLALATDIINRHSRLTGLARVLMSLAETRGRQ